MGPWSGCRNPRLAGTHLPQWVSKGTGPVKIPGCLVTTLPLVVACYGVEGASENSAVTVRDSAGVTIVVNHRPTSPHGCITVEKSPTVTIRSGGGQGDPMPILFRVAGGVALPDGRIALLNGGSRELLFYGADGTHLTSAGGPGGGPGEWLEPTWMNRGGPDTLLVWDETHRRLSMHDEAGGYLGSQQIGTDGGVGMGPSTISGRFRDGSLLTIPGGLVATPPPVGIQRSPESYGRLVLGTGRSTVLARGRGAERAVADERWYYLPFGKNDQTAALGGVLVVGDNGHSRLLYFGMDSRLRRVVTWISEPSPVTTADREAYRAHMASISPRAVPPDGAIYAEDRPRFATLQSDRLGWLWVRQYAAGWESPAPWLVFDEAGVLQCSVEAPGRVRPLEIGADYLLAVHRDDQDEETVVKYRLDRRGIQESSAVARGSR